MSSTKSMFNAFFAPSHASATTAGKPAPKLGIAFKTSALVLPKESSPERTIAWLFYLALCGTAMDGSLEQWKTLVLSYTFALLPSVMSSTSSNSYKAVELTAAQLDHLVRNLDTFKNTLAPLQAEPDMAPTDAYYTNLAFPLLPTPNTALNMSSVYSEDNVKILAAHYSLVLFLMGKRIDAGHADHSAISVARPRALRSKAHLGDSVGLLDGNFRLSDFSHTAINNAWAELPALRNSTIAECALFTQGDVNVLQDIIYTTMHLLRHSGMNHAKISYNFLQAYPWAAELPALRSAIMSYVNSSEAAVKYPYEIQPYIKLIYGDKAPIFPRNEQGPLIACAVAVARETNPTMNDFVSFAEYGPIVEAFLEERTKRNNLRQGQLDKKLADVVMVEDIQDVEE